MNNHRPSTDIFFKALFLSVLLGLNSVVTLAQTAPPAPAGESKIELSPFIVSKSKDTGYNSQETTASSRYAKNLLLIPQSITVLNAEFLADINPQSALDLVSVGVSGVTSLRTDLDQFNFRGFAISFMLRDGNMQRGYKRAPMYDIDRIEVIKGPSALSFGNNQFIGGVLNYIPYAPSATKTAKAKVTLSDHGYRRLEANLGGPIYQDQNFGLRYRITLGDEKGNYDRPTWEDDNTFASAALGFYFGSGTTLIMTASHFQNLGDQMWAEFLDRTAPISSSIAATPGQVVQKAVLNQYSKVTTTTYAPKNPHIYQYGYNDQFNVKFVHKLSENGNLSMVATYGNDLADYGIGRAAGLGVNNYSLTRIYAVDTISTRVWDINFDYLHILDRAKWKNEFTMGADLNGLSDYRWGFSRSNATGLNAVPTLDMREPNYGPDDAFFNLLFSGIPNFNPAAKKYGKQGALLGMPGAYERDQDNVNWSYYFQENLTLWKKLTLVSGLRWLNLTGKSRAVLTQVTNATTGLNTSSTTNVFSPVADRFVMSYKHGAVYLPIPDVSAYVNFSANSIPPVNVIDGFGNVIPDRAAVLKEVGLKINKSLTSTFSVFGQVVYYDMFQTNAAYNILNSAGVVINTAYSEGDWTKGLEVDLGARLKTGNGEANLYVTYTRLKSRTSKGVSFLSLPPLKYSVVSKFSWTSGPLRGLSLGLNMSDTSETLFGAFTIDEPPVYNMFASYRLNKRWGVQLNVVNITDERYVQWLSNNAVASVNPPFRPRLQFNYTY